MAPDFGLLDRTEKDIMGEDKKDCASCKPADQRKIERMRNENHYHSIPVSFGYLRTNKVLIGNSLSLSHQAAFRTSMRDMIFLQNKTLTHILINEVIILEL